MSSLDKISIIALIGHLTSLTIENYSIAEKFFTKDFCYIDQQEDKFINMIYFFLENINDRDHNYQITQMKEISDQVHLVHLKNEILIEPQPYHDLLNPQDTFILIIKMIEAQPKISYVIDLKYKDLNPIYSVLNKFT
ncbi:hypothetical protein EC846_1662 [Acinetobacter sp. BIGb0102]|uniref:hypothetical protein n=1 Tax=Acinetobacter sp. BIGb0102 TaxID=2485131 RepID=UPI000F4EC192|nr:hypothetical protein [Acinetobacter sp. BIGb0102]RPE30959.1 hypothetical protein EC846_1662 [Acinetobacter sp. BIGb0102]